MGEKRGCDAGVEKIRTPLRMWGTTDQFRSIPGRISPRVHVFTARYTGEFSFFYVSFD